MLPRATAVVGALALIAAACAGTPKEAEGAARPQRVMSAATGLSSYLRTNTYAGPFPSATSTLNPYSATFVNLQNWVFLSLGVAVPPKFSTYYPQLASSWKATGHTVTFHLHKGAKWQDGSPVTSADVATTLLLDGLDGNGIWADLTGMSTPNPRTIVLDVKPGLQPGLVLYLALQIYPVPKSVFGRFVFPGLERDLLDVAAHPGSKSAAANKVSAGLKRLASFNPKSFDGDGPFELQKLTPTQILLKKWNGYFGAARVHVPGVDSIVFASNSAMWEGFDTHLYDFGTMGVTYQAVQGMRQSQGGHVAEKNDYFLFTFAFNDHRYPFNLLGVRKAIAYALNRKVLSGLIDGHAPDSLYPPVTYPTGVPAATYKQYLTPKQIRSFARYEYDPAKAAKLLEGLGFHKVGGHWRLPNGKPFTIAIQTIAGENDSTAFALGAANMLSRFGIQAKAEALQATTQTADVLNGNFQMANLYPSGFYPLATILYTLSSENFATSTERGIGDGPVAKVPGLGSVNLHDTIAKEYATVSPSSKEMGRLVLDWTRYINQQLPIIPVTERNLAMPFSTYRFRDWPPLSSPLWGLEAENAWGGVPVMIEHGYIRPKGS